MRRRLDVWGLSLLVTAAIGASEVAAQDPVQRRGFAIAITQPANLEAVFGKTKIAANVTIDDARAIDRVEFMVGDDVIFVDREAPFECFHDFGETSRSWVVRVVAWHVEGVSVSDAVVTRRIAFATIERVNRVVLWTSVRNRDGELLLDLTRDELIVREEGKPQQILDFYREDRPITLAILLDSSGSMREKLEEVHEAAGSFVETLRDEDRALVIDFDDRVYLIQDLTSDREALKASIASTAAIGGTAIFDALHAAYRKLDTIEGRKAIVLLSDGEDSASQFPQERILEQARANGVLIYAIAVGSGDRSTLQRFAEATGGRFFAVRRARELAGVYERIAEELRAQYYVSYSTGNEVWDGRFVPVKVECARPGTKAQARSGYFAVRRGLND